MSAFIVDDAHIDYLVTAAITLNGYDIITYRNGEQTRVDIAGADTVGADLRRENIASVSYRYAHHDDLVLPEPDDYQYRAINTADITTAQVLKAIHCYEYQSCEHPGWDDSAAHDFCRRLESAFIRRIPGYDQAKWELTDNDVTRVHNRVAR